MLEFFLKYILRKGLAIPLTWGLSYPGLTGDLIIRDIRLAEPAVIAAEKADVDFRYRSIFSKEIEVYSADVRGVAVEILMDDPLQIVRCLRGGSCTAFDTDEKKKRIGAGLPGSAVRKQKKEGLKPLRVRVVELNATGGTATIKRGTNQVQIELKKIHSRDLRVPLGTSDFRVGFEFAVIDPISADKKYPLAAMVMWNGLQDLLRVRVLFKEFPLEILQIIFPTDTSGALGMALNQAGGGGGSKTTGVLNGWLVFQYDSRGEPGKQWTLGESSKAGEAETTQEEG